MSETLEGVCEVIVDCEHKTAPSGDGFALSVGTRAMKDGRLVVEACKPVSEGTYKNWTRRMRPEAGDLVLAREAPVGQVVRVPADRRICLGQRTVMIRPDSTLVHPRFLHYWLLGPDAQGAMVAQSAGATVPHVNVEDIRGLDVAPMPRDPSLQFVAATILGAIDDLIENNRRRIEVLEQMAQAIYREWFVHRQSEESASLGDLAELDRTTVQPRLFPDERFDHYSIPAFDDGQLPAWDLGASIKSGKFLVAGAAIFLSKLNPRIERTWFVEPLPGRRSIASTEFLPLRPGPGLSLEALYLTVRSHLFQERLRELSGGTSTSHQRAKPEDVLRVRVPLPEKSEVEALTRSTSPPLRMTRTLRLASRELAALRDLLLPKLVTGQIDVSALDLNGASGGPTA